MADQIPAPVRPIGTFTDSDGNRGCVGVDRQRITIAVQRNPTRLDSRAMAELIALLAAATVATDDYKALGAARTWVRCTPVCAIPVPCPTCGSSLPPRGRSVPLEMNIPACCDQARMDAAVNTRHLWSASELEPDDTDDDTDSERHPS